MKKMVVCAVLVAVLVSTPLAAHGVDVFLETGGTVYPVQTVRFQYSTGEAMSFAKVKVFAPANPGVDTVQSITDRNGYFSFIPDEAGEWRVSAEDGMGHKGEITVAAVLPKSDEAGVANGRKDAAYTGAGNNAVSGGTSGGKVPLPLGIVLGLSLILNIFWVWRRLADGAARITRRNVHAH
jgi:nickel transport protein